MPKAIFRRLDETADDYLTQVEGVFEMDSTDSSLTGMNSTVSDRTTITVHRTKKLRPEVPDLVKEENSTNQTNAKQPEKDHEASSRQTPAKGEDGSSSSNQTNLTTPVTPDTSIDGVVDLSPYQKPVPPEMEEEAVFLKPTVHDDTREVRDNSDKDNREDVAKEAEKQSPPSTENGYESVDSPPCSTSGKETNSSGRRLSYDRNSTNERTRVVRRSSRSRGRSSSLRHDEESSSDDDSSYFATHLPSPKSGRSFSVSSNASNASAFSNQYQLQKQGSDASLSFSDESDEDHHHNQHKSEINSGVHLSPIVNPNRAVADMNLYPQRITRMHSVSSLVSSASSDNRIGDNSEDEGPNRRRSYTGDDSVTSSLPSIASTGPEAMHRSLDANAPGGGYYVHGAGIPQLHPNYHPQAYMSQQPPGMQFYSQQPLSNQQMMAWATPPNDSDFEYTSSEYTSSSRNNHDQHRKQRSFGQGQHGYGISSSAPAIPHSATQRSSGSGSALRSASSGSLNYVYSEEEAAVGRGKGKNMFFSAPMGKQAADSGVPGGSNARSGNGLGAGGKSGSSGRSAGDLGIGPNQSSGNPEIQSVAVASASEQKSLSAAPVGERVGRQTFKVYWQRWIMLFYMSVLNLLSDWTCYSVAPISLLTEEAFGNIDPERLVVVFLGANAIATACEPMLLARLGLRKTVLLGSLLLTIGSIIKSGGLPPIMEPDLEKGHAEWSLYLGFFIVGLSQPLYQCTPALLSASWFPEEERTMATGVALNANQLGIGFAFIFGTLLVSEADDIIPYFGLLSQISTLCFIGTLIQFDDAPPTPPSASARVMKGNLNFRMPNFADRQIKRYFSNRDSEKTANVQAPTPASAHQEKNKSKRNAKGKKSSRSSPASKRGSSTRRRNTGPKFQTANAENGLSGPSPAHYGSTAEAIKYIAKTKAEVESLIPRTHAPSPAMQGGPADSEGDLGTPNRDETNTGTAPGLNTGANTTGQMPMGLGGPQGAYPPGQMPMGPGGPQGAYPPGQMPGYYGYGYPPQPTDFQYFQQMQQQAYYQQQMYQEQQRSQLQPQQLAGQLPMMGQGIPSPQQMPYFAPPQQMAIPYSYQQQYNPLFYAGIDYRPDAYDIDAYGDEGAEPTVTVSNNHLDIDIRDDQVVRSLHACMIRQGFSHALAAFTVSGIVINTLSTYMDYLVRLNDAPRSYTGIVGGTFQFAIMMSSLIMGKQTDKTRAYYSVTTGMLVLGAFGLAECGVSLDSDRGGDLRWSLILVAVLVGPLQPISTELGVEVAYPLSENTVLVIQQLFSNLLSAIFIPFFKSLKDIGTTVVRGGEVTERPEYTFSFYLLIVLHTLVTVYFATFNGRYLRHEHELQKKAEEEEAEADAENNRLQGEYTPLINPNSTR